jgi:hypothetical protein
MDAEILGDEETLLLMLADILAETDAPVAPYI